MWMKNKIIGIKNQLRVKVYNNGMFKDLWCYNIQLLLKLELTEDSWQQQK